jgi:2-amino-4-hydroxy-6-hydroxymethyldihydropteridine diphosphokinase
MSLTPVLLGLGSNQQREVHLCTALDTLADLLSEMRCSPVFESEAVGYRGDHFYNLVVAGRCALPLAELNQRLKIIEADNGRYAPQRKGLPLDIDILTYGDWVGTFDGVILPRGEILKNAFVLWPLSLLSPQALHPQLKRSYEDLWREAHIDQRLWPVPFSWQQQALTPTELCIAYPAA